MSDPQFDLCVQVLPTLLNYLGLEEMDPAALNWGTIAVYTCSKSCSLAAHASPAAAAPAAVNSCSHTQDSDMSSTVSAPSMPSTAGMDGVMHQGTEASRVGHGAEPTGVAQYGTIDANVAYAEEFVWVQLLQ